MPPVRRNAYNETRLDVMTFCASAGPVRMGGNGNAEVDPVRALGHLHLEGRLDPDPLTDEFAEALVSARDQQTVLVHVLRGADRQSPLVHLNTFDLERRLTHRRELVRRRLVPHVEEVDSVAWASLPPRRALRHSQDGGPLCDR